MGVFFQRCHRFASRSLAKLLMPLLWTAASYVAFSVMIPAIRDGVAWFWFVISQLIFGVVAAVVFI